MAPTLDYGLHLWRCFGFGAWLAAEAEAFGEFPALCGIIGRNQGIVQRQVPPGAIFRRGKLVIR